MNRDRPQLEIPGYALEGALASDPGELEPPLYRALHRASGERVLLATLAAELEPNRRGQILSRAQQIVQLSSPACPPLFDVDNGMAGGLLAWYTEPGETLRERLRRGPLEVAPAVSLAAALCRSFAPLHAAGVAHTTLRPASVLLTEDGGVRLLAAGLLAAPPDVDDEAPDCPGAAAAAYLAPEQLRSGAEDPASDLWTIGVLVHEMLTGELPFLATGYRQMVKAILTLDPQPLGTVPGLLPYELERLTDWALARAPEERYGGVEEMLADLEALERQLTPRSPPPAPVARRQQPTAPIAPAADWLGARRRNLERAPWPGWGRLYLLPGLGLLLLLALLLWCRSV